MRIGILIGLCVLCGFGYSQNQPIDAIVGVVGNKAILKSDIQQQQTYTSEEGCSVLRNLVNEKLLVIQSEIDSVYVNDDEIEAELDRRFQYFLSLFEGSSQSFENFYGKSVIEMREVFRPQVQDQLLANKVRGGLMADVKVSPKEVREYFNSIPKDSIPNFQASVGLGQLIIYPEISEVAKDYALKKIKDLKKRIDEGEEFGSLAYLNSQDPGSARENGLLPEFGRNDGFAKEFVNASFKLKAGEVSNIIETPFGYHLIKLVEHNGDRVKVRHILITPVIGKSDLEKAKKKAERIREEVYSGIIPFEKAVEKYSGDEMYKTAAGYISDPYTGSKLVTIETLGNIDKQLPLMIDTLTPGDISEVFPYVNQRGKKGYRFLFLREESEPHRGNLDKDYPAFAKTAEAQKKEQVMSEWYATKMEKIYVRIDEPYRTKCPNLFKTPQ